MLRRQSISSLPRHPGGLEVREAGIEPASWRVSAKASLAAAGLCCLTACQTATPPEPIIKTLPPVIVTVTQPCKAVAPALPVYPDPDAALDIFTKTQRLVAGLTLERADSRAVRQLLQACTSAPSKDTK